MVLRFIFILQNDHFVARINRDWVFLHQLLLELVIEESCDRHQLEKLKRHI